MRDEPACSGPEPAQLSDAEWTVMDAVWKRGEVTVRDVLTDVQGETDWAYSTVKTLLQRLVEKGAVSREKRGNTSVFRPAVEQKAARGAALRALVRRAFDGTLGTLVHHLVADERLSRREREDLERILRDEGLDP
ncbi:MAG: BlaI/MecI/CopY family transcriptional regulator [Thermoanaerobaculia bacterium]|nr:BlaI/MecI/CopY family transcriptional regulator [Thermoanaerobaculia bacterium]